MRQCTFSVPRFSRFNYQEPVRFPIQSGFQFLDIFVGFVYEPAGISHLNFDFAGFLWLKKRAEFHDRLSPTITDINAESLQVAFEFSWT